MIEYQLKDWKDIIPWRNGNHPMLHWFALTDSHYWFNFKGVEFPKYSDEIIKEWKPENDSIFVDYQFARIFWDNCEVIRHVEIPVPNVIFQKINSLEKLREYIHSLKAWIELVWDESDEQFDEVYEVARDWLYYRRLDFGYLTGGPDCFLIRNEDQLYIYWFAEYQNDKGVSLWDNPKGTFSCNYSEFIEGLVKSFKAFGLDMNKQISALLESNPKDLEFKISGRGFVIGGEIINSGTVLKNGDTLICRDYKNKKVLVKSIEMVNFGNREMNFNRIGLLVDLEESEVKSLIGKRLYKEA